MARKLGISKQEKKVLSYWGIGLLVVMAVVIILNIFFPMNNSFKKFFEKNNRDSNNYSIVTDFSRFSTVSAAIEKFYSFANMNDYDSVLKILDEDYVNANNITTSNIKNYLFVSDNLLSFQPNKMYVRTKKGVMTYYVDGKIIDSLTGEVYKKEYLKVILDGNKFHFSIRPIVENDYNEVANGK